MVRVELADMPPSANGLRKSFVRIDGPYTLSIAAQRNWRSKRARDIDNIIKPVSDALVKAGVVKDDSLAESVSARWADDLGGPAVVVIISEAQEALAA